MKWEEFVHSISTFTLLHDEVPPKGPQQNGRESRIRPTKIPQLSFNRDVNEIQWWNFNKQCWSNQLSTDKQMNLYLSIIPNNTDNRFKCKIYAFQENTTVNLSGYRTTQSSFLDLTSKARHIKGKLINWALSKLETFTLQKILLRG